MTIEQKIILELLGQTLFNVPFDINKYKEKIDWEAVYQEADKQTVIPTVVESMPREADDTIRHTMIGDAYECERRSYQVLLAHLSISEILKKNNVPFVIIKGVATGSYYPKLHLRKYGDVDLLISKEDVERVKSILISEDFSIGGDHPYEFEAVKNGTSYDVHVEVNGIPDGPKGDNIREAMSDMIEKATLYDFNGNAFPVTSDFHHGMIQLLHTAKHMVGFGAGLRQLCDWATFIYKMGDTFSETFGYILQKTGLWRFANVMSAACVKYMNMPSFSWIDDVDIEIIDRFMDDIMRKGGLGHNGEDDMDSVFVEEANKGGMARENMFITMLHNISGKVCYQWPIMKEHKILIPFGMAWMSVRYIVAVIKGEYKKTNLLEAIGKANKRKELYRDLGLFMEDEDGTDK